MPVLLLSAYVGSFFGLVWANHRGLVSPGIGGPIYAPLGAYRDSDYVGSIYFRVVGAWCAFPQGSLTDHWRDETEWEGVTPGEKHNRRMERYRN